jgi:hypothetical protein
MHDRPPANCCNHHEGASAEAAQNITSAEARHEYGEPPPFMPGDVLTYADGSTACPFEIVDCVKQVAHGYIPWIVTEQDGTRHYAKDLKLVRSAAERQAAAAAPTVPETRETHTAADRFADAIIDAAQEWERHSDTAASELIKYLNKQLSPFYATAYSDGYAAGHNVALDKIRAANALAKAAEDAILVLRERAADRQNRIIDLEREANELRIRIANARYQLEEQQHTIAALKHDQSKGGAR